MKKSFAMIALLAIAVGFAACRAQSPDDRALAALGRGDFDVQFWNEQSKRNTPLWHRAIDYCNQPPQSSVRSCEQFEGISAEWQLTAGGGNVQLRSTPPKDLMIGGGSKSSGNSK